MYTLQELYEELEMPLAALGRKCDVSEGTVARIRDGFPARRPTINKLLRAFSEIYGIELSLDNVGGIQIEDKKASATSKKPSVSPMPIPEKSQWEEPQISIVEPKRAYVRRKESGLPEGCMSATEFGLAHGIKRETFRDHMVTGIGPGLIHGPDVLEDGTMLVKDWVRFEERNKRVRKDGTIEKERFLTRDQQAAALDFWRRHDVSFAQCESVDCPCHRID